jgi:hypothetical protein
MHKQTQPHFHVTRLLRHIKHSMAAPINRLIYNGLSLLNCCKIGAHRAQSDHYLNQCGQTLKQLQTQLLLFLSQPLQAQFFTFNVLPIFPTAGGAAPGALTDTWTLTVVGTPTETFS